MSKLCLRGISLMVVSVCKLALTPLNRSQARPGEPLHYHHSLWRLGQTYFDS